MNFAPLLVGTLLGLATTAGTAFAQARDYTDPTDIDRTVEMFTGHPTGTPGGARSAVDPRLKLAQCPVDLAASWHGSPGRTVAVRCPTTTGWRIYVSLATVREASLVRQAVKRGETIMIVIRGRGFTVQRQGEALESGATGSWITARTSRSVQPLRARVERPGLAVIPLN